MYILKLLIRKQVVDMLNQYLTTEDIS